LPEQEKLSKFILAIHQEAEARRNQILQDVEEFNRRELAKAEEEVLADAYELIQTETAHMRSDIHKELSLQILEGRRRLISKRESLMNEVVQKAADRLMEFSKSKDYLPFLQNAIREALPHLAEAPAIFLRPEDSSLVPDLEEEFPDCVFKAADDMPLGGVRLTDNRCFIDQTLQGRLTEAQKKLIDNCPLSVV